MSRYIVTADYVDTCRPDYLQDGHNREGEWLLCTSLGGQTTEEAVDELVDQMNGEAPPESFPDEGDLPEADIRAALLDAVRGVDFHPCDDCGNLVKPDADDEDAIEAYNKLLEEQANVYVVLRWSLSDEDEDDNVCELHARAE